MTKQSIVGLGNRWPDPASVVAMANLLDSVGNVPALLHSGLCLAMRLLASERGLIFDAAGSMIAAGFAPEKVQQLRRNGLGQLLTEGGWRRYAAPEFALLAREKAPVVGLSAAVLVPGLACVLAVERCQPPFGTGEQQTMVELLRLLERAFQQTALTMNRCKPGEPWLRKITLGELPVDRLEPFPQLEEMERLLIQEAMTRSGNNKTAAAAALGMTREGLRKKMVRLGLLSAEKVCVPRLAAGVPAAPARPN